MAALVRPVLGSPAVHTAAIDAVVGLAGRQALVGSSAGANCPDTVSASKSDTADALAVSFQNTG
jgi:hypothetical protein